MAKSTKKSAAKGKGTAKKFTVKKASPVRKKAVAGKSSVSRTATPEHLEICVDRPLSFLQKHQAMYHAITHNPENIPAGSAGDRSLVQRFQENPHQNFHPEEAASLSRLAILTQNKWQKGTTLTVSFLDGSATQKKKVKKFARYWITKANANIGISFIAGRTTGMIRISFKADPGSWSAVGTDCLSVDIDKPTMNFGWLRDKTPDAEYERVVVHEFGHALGCIHEHESPAQGIHWNKPAVYAYYAGPPNNWTKKEVDMNLFSRYSASQTQFTKLDPNSIMMYPIPAKFTTDGFSVGLNDHLSPTDISFIKKIYP